PIGAIENMQPEIGGIGIWGWTIDPNTTASVVLNYYLDGHMVLGTTASVSRPDIGSAHFGYGDNHGFGDFIPTSGGTHTLCTYAINVGAGTNTNLGCHTATVGGSPIGAIENGQPEFNAIGVWGWTIDPDTADSVLMNYYVDGHMALGAVANVSRPDLGTAHPGYGNNHGFGVMLPVSSGTHQVCSYAINVGYGQNTLLGCFTTTVSGNPVGAVYGTTSEVDPGGSGNTGFLVSGFAIDPDTTNPVLMNIYLDGRMVSGFVAANPESDLATLYPGFGANHAYATWIPASIGAHNLCAYAINVGPGTNTAFTCTSFTVTASTG
ncbi:MAG TPA: hypothetical protein VHU90_12930, partial [Galbitalea sp.]|nr:hypothetical protein [Galbitalea sp.]